MAQLLTVGQCQTNNGRPDQPTEDLSGLGNNS